MGVISGGLDKFDCWKRGSWVVDNPYTFVFFALKESLLYSRLFQFFFLSFESSYCC